MNKRWYNVELDSGTDSDAFRKFLIENGIKYEASAAGKMVHFEVLVDNCEMEKCDTFLGIFIK